MILVDSHVHFYDCFDMPVFLSSAFSNLRMQAVKINKEACFTGVLLLAETGKNNWFSDLASYALNSTTKEIKTQGRIKFFQTNEKCSILIKSESYGNLFIIDGYQMNTLEGIEVLSLASQERIKRQIPLGELIIEIKRNRGIPVIPWGLGKWTGRRGIILRKFI